MFLAARLTIASSSTSTSLLMFTAHISSSRINPNLLPGHGQVTKCVPCSKGIHAGCSTGFRLPSSSRDLLFPDRIFPSLPKVQVQGQSLSPGTSSFQEIYSYCIWPRDSATVWQKLSERIWGYNGTIQKPREGH